MNIIDEATPSFNVQNGKKRRYEELDEQGQQEYRIDFMQNKTREAANEFARENKRLKHTIQSVEAIPLDRTTLNIILATGSLLWCRGKPFDDKIREVLSFEEYSQWSSISNNLQVLSNLIEMIPRDMYEKIEVLKTEAICDFVLYYQDLPPGVKLTISQAFPKYEEEMQRIVNGSTDTTNFGFILSCIWQDLVTNQVNM